MLIRKANQQCQFIKFKDGLMNPFLTDLLIMGDCWYTWPPFKKKTQGLPGYSLEETISAYFCNVNICGTLYIVKLITCTRGLHFLFLCPWLVYVWQMRCIKQYTKSARGYLWPICSCLKPALNFTFSPTTS